MVAPVDIVNLAADAIGARAQCASINPSDGSQLGDVGSRQYQIRVDGLARSAHWNCLRRQQSLTLLKAASGTPENPAGTTLPIPPQPWIYEYGLPADFLKARFIPPLFTQTVGQVPLMTNLNASTRSAYPRVAIPFVIAIDTDQDGNQIKVLLTNWANAQLVYTARITNCDLWDSLFTGAAIGTLAAFFVNPLNRNAELAKEQIAVAKMAIDQARVSDGNEGPVTTDHTPDFIAARAGGAAWWSAGWFCEPWAAMEFPGGIFY